MIVTFLLDCLIKHQLWLEAIIQSNGSLYVVSEISLCYFIRKVTEYIEPGHETETNGGDRHGNDIILALRLSLFAVVEIPLIILSLLVK